MGRAADTYALGYRQVDHDPNVGVLIATIEATSRCSDVEPPVEVETEGQSTLGEQVVTAAAEEETTEGEASEAASSTFSGFDQLVLVTEPIGEQLAANLTVCAKINAILKRNTVGHMVLGGPPQLEGVCWDPKKAPRADEIIAFIMLNGPSTLRQVALALWPDHPRPDKTASQQISLARGVLGNDATG